MEFNFIEKVSSLISTINVESREREKSDEQDKVESKPELILSSSEGGSTLGTIILVYINSEYFKLLLAFIILVYLLQSFVKIKASFVTIYPKASTYGLGLFGGMLSGLTNVVAPLMIMYTLELKYSKRDTIQLSNLCFLFTKIGQISVFIYFGTFTSEALSISMFTLIVVFAGMYLGAKVKKLIDAKFYIKILKVLLFFTALTLIVQTVKF
ncbi:MAG: sulfite exporter TauE/SafE family protein [Erysipelotrichia bacterium]|nr:sulfite exporter TauE/SafE family protein [Erysipelotrichia bacterium]